MEPDRVFNTKEAADYLRLSISQFRNLIDTVSMPYHIIGRRSIRFIESELLDWIKNQPAGERVRQGGRAKS